MAASCSLRSPCRSPAARRRPRPSSALDRIRARGELTWGADEQGGEPYAYEDPARGGALVGFEVDLADALARALGVRARFVQNDWTTLIPSLERGTFDVALNGIEVTPALAARVAFSRPYYLFTEQLVARRGDARVRDLASMRGCASARWRAAWRGSWRRAPGAERRSRTRASTSRSSISSTGASTPCCWTTSSSRATSRRHPSLAVVGDVAEGATRSRCARPIATCGGARSRAGAS